MVASFSIQLWAPCLVLSHAFALFWLLKAILRTRLRHAAKPDELLPEAPKAATTVPTAVGAAAEGQEGQGARGLSSHVQMLFGVWSLNRKLNVLMLQFCSASRPYSCSGPGSMHHRCEGLQPQSSSSCCFAQIVSSIANIWKPRRGQVEQQSEADRD